MAAPGCANEWSAGPRTGERQRIVNGTQSASGLVARARPAVHPGPDIRGMREALAQKGLACRPAAE